MFVFPSVDSTPHSTLRAYLNVLYMYLHIIMYKIAIESTENPFIHCVHDCLAHNRSLTKYDAEYVYLLCIVHIYIRTYMEVVLSIVCVLPFLHCWLSCRTLSSQTGTECT